MSERSASPDGWRQVCGPWAEHPSAGWGTRLWLPAPRAKHPAQMPRLLPAVASREAQARLGPGPKQPPEKAMTAAPTPAQPRALPQRRTMYRQESACGAAPVRAESLEKLVVRSAAPLAQYEDRQAAAFGFQGVYHGVGGDGPLGEALPRWQRAPSGTMAPTCLHSSRAMIPRGSTVRARRQLPSHLLNQRGLPVAKANQHPLLARWRRRERVPTWHPVARTERMERHVEAPHALNKVRPHSKSV